NRPRTADPRLRFLVAPRLRHVDFERVGHSEHGAERSESGNSACGRLRAPTAHLGPAPTPSSAGARSRQGTANVARIAPGARSYQSLRISRCRGVAEGPLGIYLGLASQPR